VVGEASPTRAYLAFVGLALVIARRRRRSAHA
jgi:MYXO-CTERM domain-containing protein